MHGSRFFSKAGGGVFCVITMFDRVSEAYFFKNWIQISSFIYRLCYIHFLLHLANIIQYVPSSFVNEYHLKKNINTMPCPGLSFQTLSTGFHRKLIHFSEEQMKLHYCKLVIYFFLIPIFCAEKPFSNKNSF